MIANAEGTVVLSSLGWVGGDSIWHFDTRTGQTSAIALDTGGRYASLHCDGSNLFAVGHHFDGARFEVSVRAFASPDAVLSRAVVSPTERTVGGDRAVWDRVPGLYPEYLSFPPHHDYVLIRVRSGEIQLQRLDWFDDSYDKGYQGVVGALALPGSDYALISVQRSSRLILHDLEAGRMEKAIDLVDRGGGEAIALRNAGTELWARDYDTVVVLSTNDWRVLRSARLEKAAPGVVRQFIGGVAFMPGTDLCLVARPFSGDVVAIDAQTLQNRRGLALAGSRSTPSPLTVATSSREIGSRARRSADAWDAGGSSA